LADCFDFHSIAINISFIFSAAASVMPAYFMLLSCFRRHYAAAARLRHAPSYQYFIDCCWLFIDVISSLRSCHFIFVAIYYY